RQQLDLDRFDRIIGSLHTLPVGERRHEPDTLFRRMPAEQVIRRYLAELPARVAGDAPFEIVTHLDYALRYSHEVQEEPVHPCRPARRRRERPGPGDEHPAAVAVDAAVVERGGRVCDQLRQRRPHRRGARARLPRGDGDGRGVRLPPRPRSAGPLAAVTVAGSIPATTLVSTQVIGSLNASWGTPGWAL